MRIPSSLIPQADVLQDVIRVVEAVYGGARTFQDIAYSIGKVERQGRYYRLAAEILGFIKNKSNQSTLTNAGREYIESVAKEKDTLLVSAVLGARIFQRMVAFLELHPEGIAREQIAQFLSEVTEPVGPSMLPRRISTVISWLEAVNIVENDNGRYRLKKIQRIFPVTPAFDEMEPLLPGSSDLKEYEEVQKRTSKAKSSILFYRNQAASERAEKAHIQLVNLVAQRIRQAGGLPKSNSYIDLATRMNKLPYLFEMKSTTLLNTRSQIRRGLSQLFEYRYIQNLPEANLVLVIEKPLRPTDSWMKDYLEKDRDIKLVWDGNRELYASAETRENLNFLWSS